MKSVTQPLVWAIVLSACLWVSSCTHDAVIPDAYTSETPYVVGNCNPDTMYYNRDIAPIILSNCATSGCHNATTAAHGINLSSYSSVISTGKIRPFNSSNSEFMNKNYTITFLEHSSFRIYKFYYRFI